MRLSDNLWILIKCWKKWNKNIQKKYSQILSCCRFSIAFLPSQESSLWVAPKWWYCTNPEGPVDSKAGNAWIEHIIWIIASLGLVCEWCADLDWSGYCDSLLQLWWIWLKLRLLKACCTTVTSTKVITRPYIQARKPKLIHYWEHLQLNR